MDAANPPPSKPAEREPRPRRGYRAVPMVLVVVLLAVNVGLTGRAVWRLERQASAPAPTLAEIARALAGADQGAPKAGPPGPAPAGQAAFRLDSVAVLPFTGPGPMHKEAVAEAEKAGPALAGLLSRDRRLRVAPFDRARQAKGPGPQAAGRELGAQAVLVGALTIRKFVSESISLRMQLIDVETGLTLWAESRDLGPYSEAAVEWKPKLTEALVAAAKEVSARAGERAPAP